MKWRWAWRVVLGLLAVGALMMGASRLAGPLLSTTEWIQSSGPLAPLLFGLLYAVGVVALVPASLLTMAAGALFGVVQGTLIVFTAATTGAAAAFLLGRYAARPAVERRIASDGRFERIDRAIARRGLRIVLLLRLTPVVPFGLLNYALGTTRVTLRDYLLGSVGMIPGTVLYVYSGRLLGALTEIAAGVAPPRGPLSYVVLALGLLATLAVVVVLTRVARDALREEEVQPGSESASGDQAPRSQHARPLESKARSESHE